MIGIALALEMLIVGSIILWRHNSRQISRHIIIISHFKDNIFYCTE